MLRWPASSDQDPPPSKTKRMSAKSISAAFTSRHKHVHRTLSSLVVSPGGLQGPCSLTVEQLSLVEWWWSLQVPLLRPCLPAVLLDHVGRAGRRAVAAADRRLVVGRARLVVRQRHRGAHRGVHRLQLGVVTIWKRDKLRFSCEGWGNRGFHDSLPGIVRMPARFSLKSDCALYIFYRKKPK